MSWKFVFNSRLSLCGKHESMSQASNAGYRFMLFNEDVLWVADGSTTGIRKEDLV